VAALCGQFAGFEFTAVSRHWYAMKLVVFWDVTSRSLAVIDRRFRGVFCLYHHLRNVGQIMHSKRPSILEDNHIQELFLEQRYPVVLCKETLCFFRSTYWIHKSDIQTTSKSHPKVAPSC